MAEIENINNQEENLNLYQKLSKIRSISDVAQKSKKGYNYSYTDILDILAKVTTGMKKYGVSLIPSIVPSTGKVVPNVVVNTKCDKTGKTYDSTKTEMMFSADMMFEWINDENPSEKIQVPWYICGSMEDCAQAMGSGLTYTLRQFLTAYFQIAQSTEVDIDTYRSKQKEAEVSEDKAVAEEIISGFDTLVKQYLSDHPDSTDDVKKFVSRYAKNANYLSIKDPALASKLLSDFKDKYLKESK